VGIKDEKVRQLGMDPGTASNRLGKALLFSLGKKLNMDWCFHCAARIESYKDMSIEHKVPWLHSKDPSDLYFDLDNIAFSHKSCNYKAARPRVGKPCPSSTAYRKGCRCEGCKKIKRDQYAKSY